MDDEIVWLIEYRRFGVLLKRDAYHSIIATYNNNGEPEQVVVENDDYELWEERAIDYESE